MEHRLRDRLHPRPQHRQTVYLRSNPTVAEPQDHPLHCLGRHGIDDHCQSCYHHFLRLSMPPHSEALGAPNCRDVRA